MKLNSGMLTEPILVGRELELRELMGFLCLAIEGKGTTVFVSGEAGNGKTRLVNEFLHSAQQKNNVVTLAGWCLYHAGVPYFPFIEAFNPYFSTLAEITDYAGSQESSVQAIAENAERLGNEKLELNAFLKGSTKPGSKGIAEYLTPQALKDQTFAAVTRALLKISKDKTTILFIDDVHWADSASLALLHYISRAIASQRVLVLATYRSEDLNPDDEGHPHPLVEALRLMGRDNLFKEIKLQSLSQNDVSLLAENMVGGRVQTELAEKLASESQGNPLFVVESLRMLSEKGNLVEENSRWCLATGDIGIPAKIKDIILRRVSVLKPDERQLLDFASVVGSKFDAELLGAVLGQSSLEVLQKLSGIAQSSSLVVCDGSVYRFDHVKSRDALYEAIPLPLRKAYHSSVAERIGAGCRGGKLPVADLAYHYVQAGNREKAVKYSLAAGEEALALFCGAEAIKHFKYVLDTTADETEYANERAFALEGLGDGLFARARCREAVEVFEQLSSSAKSDLVKLRALRKAMYASLMQGDMSRALEIAGKAVENPKLDRLESARVHLQKGLVKSYEKGGKEALPFMEESLRVFEEEYSLPDVAEALINMGAGYSENGQLENALAAELRSCALTECIRDLNRQFVAHIWLDIVFMFFGLLREAEESNIESFKIAEKVSDPISLAWEESIGYWVKAALLENMASVIMLSGFSFEPIGEFMAGTKIKFSLGSPFSGALGEFKRGLKTAVVAALKGAECAEETDSHYARALNYTKLTQLYAELGDMEDAEKYYQKMVKLVNETNVAEMRDIYSGWLFSEAIFFSSKRQWKEANRFYEESLERDRKAGEHPLADQAGLRLSYCLALLQQKRFADAKLHFEEAKKIMIGLEKRFMHSTIQAYLMAPREVEAGKEFNMRLDIVNVGKAPSVLIKVEDVVPYHFKVTATQPHFIVQQGSIEMEKKALNPFRNEAITLTVQPTKEGTFILNPQVAHINDSGETKTCHIKPVTISVKSAQIESKVAVRTSGAICLDESEKPFNVFLCYKKSSGKDFADHLKAGLEELGLHTFLDSKDIPQMIGWEEEWARIRDKALEESKIFILLMTPGFNLSPEVIKELNLARKCCGKEFVYFRHRNLGRKFTIQLDNEVLDFSKQEQVSFETKEELLRLAHNILFKGSTPRREPSKDKHPENDSEIEIVKKFGLSRST